MATKKQTRTATRTASKAKGKASKGRKATRAATLPNGYRVIGRAPSWDMDKDPRVSGVRGETHEITVDKGKKTEAVRRNFIIQDETLGAVTIWESGMLRDLFDSTDDGDDIFIEFLGLGTPAKKGHNAPRLFSCGIKE